MMASCLIFSILDAVELARRFQTDGMLAYVELVQRKEKELGCDVLTHQKWSGASYIDRILNSKHTILMCKRTQLLRTSN